MGDTCTGSVSMALCNPQRSSSVRATMHRDCQDQVSSLEGPLHQPSSTGPCSVALPSLCQNFPGSDWPHQLPSNPPSPIGWTISEDGHLSPREDKHHHYHDVDTKSIFTTTLTMLTPPLPFLLPLSRYWHQVHLYHHSHDADTTSAILSTTITILTPSPSLLPLSRCWNTIADLTTTATMLTPPSPS